MKVILILFFISGSLIAKAPSHIEVINPKKGHLRFSHNTSFVQSELDQINILQILNHSTFKYGLKPTLMLQINMLSSSSWMHYINSESFQSEYHSQFHLLSMGLSKNLSSEKSDFGLITFIKTPLISKQYFYNDSLITSERENFNYIQYGISFYKLTPPLVPTIRLSHKIFFDKNNFIPGNELSINFNINFSVNDDWTLLWGAGFQNKKQSTLFKVATEFEKNTIFFNYGILYDLSHNMTFKLGCAFNFSQEDTSIISMKTSYRF